MSIAPTPSLNLQAHSIMPQQMWIVEAVVAGPAHIDGLFLRTVTAADLECAAAELCIHLNPEGSPFGDYFLVATPARLSPQSRRTVRDRTPEHTLICRLTPQSDGRGELTRGPWRPAVTDSRFLTELTWTTDGADADWPA